MPSHVREAYLYHLLLNPPDASREESEGAQGKGKDEN